MRFLWTPVYASIVALAPAIMLSALATPAFAGTITFETAPNGPGFTGPVTENGFTYSTLSGSLFVESFGNPGQDMEGAIAPGGGVLRIVSAGGNFAFNSLDFAAFNTPGTGSQTLTVQGYLGATLVGTDQFTLANTSIFSPAYANWTTEHASVLAGQTISQLDITLQAGNGPPLFVEAIDNVSLTSTAPEPMSLALVVTGVLCLCLFRRRSQD